jgi:hypothetical protein
VDVVVVVDEDDEDAAAMFGVVRDGGNRGEEDQACVSLSILLYPSTHYTTDLKGWDGYVTYEGGFPCRGRAPSAPVWHFGHPMPRDLCYTSLASFP